ncbi:MAG: mutual gliding-motility protein MglA, partial [Thermoanaerobaculia bacterium]|nr:mutual gliding-motility protein MglA [Thermoanaerobaculia bacterium]
MVFFNYATMQMAAKIVYYGPGLCGKTTNLHHIYAKTSPQSRGEMVSLETETDRTLFFDLLPIDVGVIGGFKTRLQLYTIPGQVFYNTTRKLVLKGVDGIVFVADSQKAMLDANLESFKNLRENLAEIGLSIDEIPLVLQINKRDLPNIAPVDDVVDVIDPERKYDFVEAVASRGDGVFETLKVISKLTLRTLRRRMTGEEPVKPTPRRPAPDMTFRVREDTNPIPAIPAAPASPAATAPIAAYNPPPEVEEIAEEAFIPPPPPPEPPPPPVIAAPAPPPHVPPPPPEPEIDFGQTEKPAKAAPDVKHVKVRSSVDIMAE